MTVKKQNDKYISTKVPGILINFRTSRGGEGYPLSVNEKETLEGIISLRNSYENKKDLNITEATKMNNQLNKYLAIVENYPELKANEQYLDLQRKLSSIEDELVHTRHIYNEEVTRYNTLIESVPNNIIASIFAFKKAEWFETDEESKENVKVEV